MAKLKIEAPNGNFLLVDVGEADPAEYDDLANAALDDYKASLYGSLPSDVVNEKGLEDATMADAKNVGNLVKAGGSGIADLVSGNGLQQAAKDVEKVSAEKSADTTAGKVGAFIGGLATPEQIAMQGALAPVAEAIGPAVSQMLKGWSEGAALNAVGSIKNIAKSVGVKNLDAIGSFLLQPVKIGERELPAVVSATNSPKDMLNAIQAIKQAAGKALGGVSTAMDASIKSATEMGADAPVALDVASLQKTLALMKSKVAKVAPNLGKALINQYDNAILDLQNVIQRILEGDSKEAFSNLSELKTVIGDLVYKHGSPLESKAALEEVYHAIANTLDDAATKVGGKVGEAYSVANETYHKAVAIEAALEGKVASAAKWFDAPSFLAAMSAGFATHGPLAALTVPAAYVGAKVGQNYAPQAIAQGLGATAPLIGSALRGAVRALPVAGNAIASGLNLGK